MKERPILFSGPMVRAILDGRKTQMRRVVKRGGKAPIDFYDGMFWFEDGDVLSLACPYGVPGDRLWVKESFAVFDGPAYGSGESDEVVVYAADHGGSKEKDRNFKYKPSIHMPRWASRIALEITEVRVQRVQEIGEEDARAEGAKSADYATGRECILDSAKGSYRLHFRDLWDSINAKRGFGWDANPFVRALTFRRVKP